MNSFVLITFLQILACFSTNSLDVSYVGCFTDRSQTNWRNKAMMQFSHGYGKTLGVLDCATDLDCFPRNRSFVSVYQNHLCLCSEEAPKEDDRISDNACDSHCKEIDLNCGGLGSLSIYHVADDSQTSQKSLDRGTERKLLEFSRTLRNLGSLERKRKNLREEMDDLNARIAEFESTLIELRKDIVDNSGECSLVGSNMTGSTNGTKWLEDLMKDPMKSERNILEFIKSDKEQSLDQAKKDLLEANIRSLQDKLQKIEERRRAKDECSI